MSPSSAAVGSSETFESMALPPGSRRTRIFMIHPAFASEDRLRDIAYLHAPIAREWKENALDILRAYDTVIVVNDSVSMLRDHRWEQVRVIVIAIRCVVYQLLSERLVEH